MDRWVDRERNHFLMPVEASYQVRVSREPGVGGDPSPFHSEAQIRIGDRTWKGRDTGKTLQESVERMLRHLQSTPVSDRPPPAEQRGWGDVA